MEKEKRKQAPQTAIKLLFSGIAWFFKGTFKLIWGLGRFVTQAVWWTIKQTWRSSAWLIKQPYRIVRYLINGRIPEFENARQEEIFWRIKRQYRRKRLFTLHTVAYIIGIFASLGTIIYEFDYLQRLLNNPNVNPEYLWLNFNQTAISVGIGLGIWTLLLAFHFYFNRTGNEEDQALSEALEKEYARTANPSQETYKRLAESYSDEEIDHEAKPKRNHGVHS